MAITNELTQAVLLMQQGQEAAFATFYNHTYPYVYGKAKYIMHDEQDALDLVQETYVQAYRGISGIADVNNVYAWLGGIVYRQGMKIFNKKKEVLTSEGQEYLFDELEETSATPEQTAEMTATANIVQSMIEELPELQRVAVMAYYYDNMKIDDIAAMCECSSNTIKSRLNYAKKYLKDRVVAHEKKYNYKLCSLSPAVLFFAFRTLFCGSKYAMQPAVAQGSFLAICNTLGINAYTVSLAGASAGATGNVAASAVGTGAGAAAEASTGALSAAVGMSLGTKIAIGVGIAIAAVGVGAGTTIGITKVLDNKNNSIVAEDNINHPGKDESTSDSTQNTSDGLSTEVNPATDIVYTFSNTDGMNAGGETKQIGDKTVRIYGTADSYGEEYAVSFEVNGVSYPVCDWCLLLEESYFVEAADGNQYIIIETSEYNDWHNYYMYQCDDSQDNWFKVLEGSGDIENFESLEHFNITSRGDLLGTHSFTDDYRYESGSFIKTNELSYYLYWDENGVVTLKEGVPVPESVKSNDFRVLETAVQIPTTINGQETILVPGIKIYPYASNDKGEVFYLLEDGTMGMFHYTDDFTIEGMSVNDCFVNMSWHYAG